MAGGMKSGFYSIDKDRQTAMVLVATTAAGATCSIGPAYPGTMASAEEVRRSGLIGEMKEGGLAEQGLQVVADKNLKSISLWLIRESFLDVPLPR